MKGCYPNLFSSLRIGKITFRNRIFATPSTSLSDLHSQLAFFEAKAKGGAAQVCLAETAISKKYLLEPKGTTFVLDGDEYELGRLGEFVLAIKAYGAVPSIQLTHHGQQSRPDRNDGRNPVGPMAYKREDGVDVAAMDEDLIEEIIEAYANAAVFCVRAGFDMCMLHGAHGWLLAQFLSPYNNKRKDRWGGNLENRARFPIEVINRIRHKCGRDFLIEYRISGDELIEGGMQIDEVVEFVKMIENDIDIIHVSAGIHDNHFTIKRMFPVVSFTEPGCNVYLAASMKKHVKIPVVTVGGINTPEQAERILSEGKADIIGMCRQLICDPDFPKKARRGQKDEIIPCMRCNCCISDLLPGGGMQFGCAANPKIGRDNMLQRVSKPEASRNVVVVGGGPSGMMAALTAKERGHRVTLLEKSSMLGGILKTTDNDPAKLEIKRYKDFLINKVHNNIADIKLNTAGTAAAIEALSPDVVIAAVGAQPTLPEIPGVDKDNALTYLDVYYHTEKIGQNVVIIGGGLVGCESALFLANKDKNVLILEVTEVIGDPGYPHYHIPLLEAIDSHPKIRYELKAECVKIEDESITVLINGEEREIISDSIIFLVGLSPNLEAVEDLRDHAPEFYSVGDCVKPQRIMEATRTGFFNAINIL